jgi:L-lactate utilization protein LutC
MERSSQLQERMLARIRASLSHPATASAPEELPRFPSQTPAGHVESLIDEFSEELEKVGGQVAHVHSGDEVRQHIERLLLLSSDASVAVSDGQLVQELCIREWLLSLNTRVVTCMEEAGVRGQRNLEPQHRHESAGEVTSMERYRRVLLECGIGVTSADYALADTGTLVLISGGEQHRLISLLPPVHVCLLAPSRIFPGLTQLLAHLSNEFYSLERPPQALTCITGPSRTADIEHTITMGVHGPKSLHVLLYSPVGQSDF